MGKYLVLGGTQKKSKSGYKMLEWEGYERALGIEVDTNTMRVKPVIDYVSPLENRHESKRASILFKAGTICGQYLVACTQTEVLIFDRSTYALINTITHPFFNDVHHARLSSSGTLLVVSTGLDALFEFDLKGNLIREWPVDDFNLWDRFDKDIDYRKILTTKPHSNHPNYCFETKTGVWVTRFKNRDAICLETGETLPIEVGGPHDGEISSNSVFFYNCKWQCCRVSFGKSQRKKSV